MGNQWIVNFLYDDDENTRWLIEFDVPKKYSVGPHSLSIPKWIINDFVAVYGYDPHNQRDLDDIAEHMLYFAYIRAVHYSNTRREPFNVYLLEPSDARKAVDIAIEKLKSIGEIVLHSPVEYKVKVPGIYDDDVKSMFVPGKTALDIIREDIPHRVDPEMISVLQETTERRRSSLKNVEKIGLSPENHYCIIRDDRVELATN